MCTFMSIIVNVDNDCDIKNVGNFNCDIRNLNNCENMEAVLEFLNDYNLWSCTFDYVANITYTFHCKNRNARLFIEHFIVPKLYCDI